LAARSHDVAASAGDPGAVAGGASRGRPILADLTSVRPDDALPAFAPAEVDAARRYRDASRAASTRAKYAADWRAFSAWCRARGHAALPAHPGVVAVFLFAEADRGCAPSTLGRVLAALGHHHRLAGLVAPAIACRAYERLETRGHLDAMLARYSTLRQYLPAFLALPFQAAPGSETLLGAIEILRALDAGTRGPLTKHDPHGFVQADWRAHLITDDKASGELDRAIWEISLALAVRAALRAGGLFLAQSRDHVSFWNLIYDKPKWQTAREQAYQRLDLPIDGQAFLGRLIAEFDRAARAAERGMSGNRFAEIRDGRLRLKRRDAMAIPRAA